MTGNDCAPEERSREGRYGVFILLFMDAVPVAGGVHLRRRVSGANTAGFGWEANEVRWAGIRIMSGGNSDRTTTCLTSRES